MSIWVNILVCVTARDNKGDLSPVLTAEAETCWPGSFYRVKLDQTRAPRASDPG